MAPHLYASSSLAREESWHVSGDFSEVAPHLFDNHQCEDNQPQVILIQGELIVAVLGFCSTMLHFGGADFCRKPQEATDFCRNPFVPSSSHGNITRVSRNLAFVPKKEGVISDRFLLIFLFWGRERAKKTCAQPWYARKSGNRPSPI